MGIALNAFYNELDKIAYSIGLQREQNPHTPMDNQEKPADDPTDTEQLKKNLKKRVKKKKKFKDDSKERLPILTNRNSDHEEEDPTREQEMAKLSSIMKKANTKIAKQDILN